MKGEKVGITPVTKKGKKKELRIKTPPENIYNYVAELSKKGKRSIPKQLEIIIEEHQAITSKIKNN